MHGVAAFRHPWVHGPVPDLLIGCGGLYAIGFALLLLMWDASLASPLSYLLPMAVLSISLPHYGATLARAYGSREQTLRYAVVTIYVTALLVAWFALGTWNALVGSLMITLYLSWSPWHYSGQNYGLTLMFIGRAGFELTPRVKTALWWSFVLSYGLTLISLHANGPAYDYTALSTDTTLKLIPLGIPASVRGPLFVAVAVVYAASLVVAGRGLVRAGSLRSLAPAAAMVFSQALWFVVPYAASQWLTLGRGTDDAIFLQNAILWVAIAHAAQYIWITSHYARSTSSWRGYGRYFARIFAFGSVGWTLPAILFGPSTLGSASYAQGLTLLIAAVVNLHHFVLDGAIWKLRNSRIASILIRDEAETHSRPELTGRRGVRVGVVVAVATACVVFHVVSTVGTQVVVPMAIDRGKVDVAAAVLDAGEPFAIGTVRQRVEVGALLLDAGDREGAERAFEGALSASDDNFRAHYLLGRMRVEDGDLRSGIEHLHSALALRPNFGPAKRQLHDAMKRARQSGTGDP